MTLPIPEIKFDNFDLKSKILELLDIYFTFDYATTFFYISPIFRRSLENIQLPYTEEQFQNYIESLQRDLTSELIDFKTKELIVNNLKVLRQATCNADIENELWSYLETSYYKKIIAYQVIDLYYNFFNQNLDSFITFLAITQSEFNDHDVLSLFENLNSKSDIKISHVLQLLQDFITAIREKKYLILFIKEILISLAN